MFIVSLQRIALGALVSQLQPLQTMYKLTICPDDHSVLIYFACALFGIFELEARC